MLGRYLITVSYFVIVAGEPSGDILGSELIKALKKDYPEHRFEGIAGPEMIKSGCVPWYHVSDLSVMGIFGVLRHLPRILGIRKKLLKKISEDPPDAFIGIDYPDFNLGIEKKLKQKNIKTIHMVAPSFWAWREGRIRTIKKSVDLLLCLFPFEEELLKKHSVNTKFIGHPLAHSIAEENDMYSYFVSAKTGDMVSSSFFRIAADLAGVVLTKPEMDVAVKPIQAAIVDYQRDDETENRPAKVHDRGGKSGCMLQ